MIIKHGSPRKTPDLYSDKLYNEICNDLNIHDSEQRGYFKETIERAALSLIKSKDKNKNRLTDGQEKSELLRLAKSLNKSRKIFDDLCNKNQLGEFRFFSPIKFKRTPEEEAIIAARKEVFGDFYNNSETVSLALLALEKTALYARENPYHFRKKNKTEIVLEWIWYFSDDWEEISDIKFSEGREYESPALRVLKKLVFPINEKLQSKDKITDSMLAEAITMHREYQKNHPEEDD